MIPPEPSSGDHAPRLNLKLASVSLAVCRLPASAPAPAWAMTGQWRSLTWTADELSVVCLTDQVPANVQSENDWRSFQVEGPLDFGLTGVLLAIAAPLAAAKISIFAVSTYDTDYVLVKQADLDAAIVALRRAGHQVTQDQVTTG